MSITPGRNAGRNPSYSASRNASQTPSCHTSVSEVIIIDDENDADDKPSGLYDSVIDLTDEDDENSLIEWSTDEDLPLIASSTDDEIQVISVSTRPIPQENRWGLDPAHSRRTTRKPKKPFVAFEPRVKPVENIKLLQRYPFGDRDNGLASGDFVELQEDPASNFKCGDFLKIHQVYKDCATHDVYLRGTLFRRSRTLTGMLPRKLNEVYQVLQHNLEDSHDTVTQSLHDVSITSVLRVRLLWQTNRPYPQDTFRTAHGMPTTESEVRDKAPLTCRWKRIFHYRCISDLTTGHAFETSIEKVTEREADPTRSVPDAALRKAIEGKNTDISVIDVDANTATENDTKDLLNAIERLEGLSLDPGSKNNSRELTFADFFCGAGGISTGARRAGFTLKYGVDHNKEACETMRLNFPNMQIFHEDIYDNLVNRMQAHAHVRACHFSTVCKTISPAYTVRGKNHDANEATLFCISDILRKATPMVATLEQTFGATGPNKQQIFAAFVQQFTDLGYSVRWAVKDLSEYGVPQRRKRLLMIGACPGHPLPVFPEPTHGPGLKRFNTIGDAIAAVRPGMPNHNPALAIPREHLSYGPAQFLPGCITTSGGIGNYHPSGRRDFTERELACLQTFPLDHVFVGTKSQCIQQIGNAVPPVFSEQLFRSIRKTFEEVDVLDADYEHRMQKLRQFGGDEQAPIDLGDDSDDEMDEDDPKEIKPEPAPFGPFGGDIIVID